MLLMLTGLRSTRGRQFLMLILGLSSFKDDAAAALLRDGAVIAAIENRKLEASASTRMPEAAMRFCLDSVKASWSDLDLITVASNPVRGLVRRALSRSCVSPTMPIGTIYQEGKEIARYIRDRMCIGSLNQRTGGERKVLSIDHHLCHVASAFFLSPFERALILTLDGEGDGNSGMIAVGQGAKIEIKATLPISDSIGRVYSRITHAIGFVPSKQEHKTQWLSLEGKPIHKAFFCRIMQRSGGKLPRIDQRYFSRGLNGIFTPSSLFWREIGIGKEPLQLSLEEKRDIATSLQAAMGELISEWVAELRKKTGFERVCFGGGVFQNTLLVAALENRFGSSNTFVPPAPGNPGCAIGATIWLWHHEMGRPRNPEIRSVYWGPSYTRAEIKDVLDNVKARYTFLNTGERKLECAVQLLQGGKIVGWFQGATEFGPRALGHRSILASPWAPYVTENLNDFIKHREAFRPFAVSVREEDCERYFTGSPLCRLMNSLGCVRHDADVLPPSLKFADGLVRLHIVQKDTDAILWQLLERFGQQAIAPILVNTSFNLPGEPPVVQPRDAVRTFFCSGIDALFIDNFLLTKSSAIHILPASYKIDA